jgi:hypothetical protein
MTATDAGVAKKSPIAAPHTQVPVVAAACTKMPAPDAEMQHVESAADTGVQAMPATDAGVRCAPRKGLETSRFKQQQQRVQEARKSL